MITFYYINRKEIEQQYAQIVPYIVESIEESSKTSGKAKGKISLGSWLKVLGLNLGEAELGGELNRESAQKILRKLSEEQKVALVWKDLRDKGQLEIITESTAVEIDTGMQILFEGMFSLSEHTEEGVSRVEGTIGNNRVIILFSEKFMPASVLASLRYVPTDLPLSGYGTVIQAGRGDVIVRPIAFGLGFLNVLKLD
jgi:hypothetical protein